MLEGLFERKRSDKILTPEERRELQEAKEALESPGVQAAFTRLERDLADNMASYVGKDVLSTHDFYIECGTLLRAVRALKSSLHAPVHFERMRQEHRLQNLDPDLNLGMIPQKEVEEVT